MPSISGSDGQYNYYQKQLNDLSDENSADRKKAKEREDERVSALESRHSRELREQEQEHDRSLAHSKDALGETLKTERETSKQEYADLKKNTYDRFGQLNADHSAEFNHQMNEMQGQYRAQKLRHDDELHSAEQNFTSHLAERDQQASAETERAVANTREDLENTHHYAMESQRKGDAQASADAKHSYDVLDKNRLEDLSTQRHQYESAFADSKNEYSRRLEAAKNAYEKSTQRQENTLRASQSDNTDALRQAHARETQELRDKMGSLIAAEKDYVKDSAKASSEAVANYENEWRDRLSTQDTASKNQTADLKMQNTRTQEYLAHKNGETMQEKDGFFTRLISQEQQAHADERRDLTNSYMRDRKQMEVGIAKDKAMQQKVYEARMDDAAAGTQRAMQEQAKALSNSAAAQHQEDTFNLNRAQKALQEHQTSADTTLISPAAEAALRKQIANQYDKTAQADIDRRARESEGMRDEYQNQFRDQHEQALTKENKMNRAVALEKNADLSKFNSHVADIEFMKDDAIRSKDASHARETENLTKNYSRVLQRQTREQNDTLDASRNEAASRINAVREEYEFNQKMAQREYATKYTETVRAYERKLSDQKTDSDVRLEDQRAAAATAAREADRKFKSTLDEVTRNSDQKLAQQEAQHRERERYITQTFQDELEKMRRSNQALINRRG